MLLADTTVATFLSSDFLTFEHNEVSGPLKYTVPGETWNDSLEPLGDVCVLGTMAHAAEDADGTLFGAAGCFGAQGSYHLVFTISPEAPTKRSLLAKAHLPRGRPPSYMHALGSTPNHVVLIGNPLYMNMEKIASGHALGEGGLTTTKEETIFQIISKRDGSVRSLHTDGFIFGHVLNTFEEESAQGGTDVVVDLTWYEAGNATTLGWFNRWFLSHVSNLPTRESWPRSRVMRYRLRSDGTVERSILFAEERGQNDFEVPKIHEGHEGQPYCVVYMMQLHSYAYDEDANATALASGPMGAVGIAKRDICSGARLGWYTPNEYI